MSLQWSRIQVRVQVPFCWWTQHSTENPWYVKQTLSSMSCSNYNVITVLILEGVAFFGKMMVATVTLRDF